jgi:hypothetical protein
MRHYFQDLFGWIDQIPDGRDPKRIRYRVRELIGTGRLMFLLKLESRRQLNEERGQEPFDTNASGFFHGWGIAPGDSVNYFLDFCSDITRLLHHIDNRMVKP